MIKEQNCAPLGSCEYLVKNNYNKYRYLVKLRPNGKNYCEYPKEAVSTRKIRGMETVYFQYNQKCKRITYDKSLWLTEVLYNDPIEEELINIKNTWPNWYSIDVFLNDN